MKNVLVFSIITLSLLSCNSSQNNFSENINGNEEVFTNVVQNTSSAYKGIYKGIFPCGDCNGVETIITLGDIVSEGASYTIQIIHSENNNKKISEHKGFYRLTDDTGRIIELVGLKSIHNRYLVVKNAIIRMADGKVIQDKSGCSMYVLNKQ